MTKTHVSQTQTANNNATNGLPLEADFERTMPKTGSIQYWADDILKSIQTRSYEIVVRHRLEQWLIIKVAKCHPRGIIGAMRWFSMLSLPRANPSERKPYFSTWADEMYRIITSEVTDEQGTYPFCTTEEQETMMTCLKNDLRGRDITEKQIATWLLSKQMPQRPKRPEGPRQLIRTTVPPQKREPKIRSTPMPQHHTKPPVFTKDDYCPTDVEIAERIIQLQDQMRDIGGEWDDADLLDTARRQIIAEHKQSVAA